MQELEGGSRDRSRKQEAGAVGGYLERFDRVKGGVGVKMWQR
jgi:hypothetical protein